MGHYQEVSKILNNHFNNSIKKEKLLKLLKINIEINISEYIFYTNGSLKEQDNIKKWEQDGY